MKTGSALRQLPVFLRLRPGPAEVFPGAFLGRRFVRSLRGIRCRLIRHSFRRGRALHLVLNHLFVNPRVQSRHQR